MNAKEVYAVRNARGLSTNEKVFLYTVASHNEGMFATWDKNAEDMGFGKDSYYRCRKSLTDKGVLKVQRRMDDTTVYAIDLPALEALSLTENADSLTAKSDSLTENGDSLRPETKVNNKGNVKGNSKGNTNEAPASPRPTNKDETNKEEQSLAPAAPRKVSPIGSNVVEVPPIEVIEEPSLILNEEEGGAAAAGGWEPRPALINIRVMQLKSRAAGKKFFEGWTEDQFIYQAKRELEKEHQEKVLEEKREARRQARLAEEKSKAEELAW